MKLNAFSLAYSSPRLQKSSFSSDASLPQAHHSLNGTQRSGKHVHFISFAALTSLLVGLTVRACSIEGKQLDRINEMLGRNCSEAIALAKKDAEQINPNQFQLPKVPTGTDLNEYHERLKVQTKVIELCKNKQSP